MTGFEIFFDDIGAGDIRRHEIGRELYATELKSEGICNCAHHESFCSSWHAGQKAVTADENCDEDLIKHFRLADDYLAHLPEYLVAYGVETVNALLEQRCFLIQSG